MFYRSVLLLYLQTEGGVVPAGVLHPSVSVFVGTLHLQAEQPLAGQAVLHDAIRTCSQPGPPSVDEETAVLNRDRVTGLSALQSLQDDIIIINMLMRSDINMTHLSTLTHLIPADHLGLHVDPPAHGSGLDSTPLTCRTIMMWIVSLILKTRTASGVSGAWPTCNSSQVGGGWDLALAIDEAAVSDTVSHRGRDPVLPPGEPVLISSLSTGQNLHVLHNTPVHLDPQTKGNLIWFRRGSVRVLARCLWRIGI